MSYGRILVPFDGSPLAKAALSIGAWLAWRANSQIDLFRAVSASGVPFTPRSARVGRLMVEAQATDRAEAEPGLNLETEKLRKLDLEASGIRRGRRGRAFDP